MKANFFVGKNLGGMFFKMGFLCLIGIAHLPDSMAGVKFMRSFEFRPTLTTNIGPLVEEELIKVVPKKAHLVTKNLLCAIKTVCAHVLHRVPICGNITYTPEQEPVVR